jgi:hypothetical protein
MIIDLVFSQPDLLYYYFENGKGLNFTDFAKQQAQENGGGNGNNDGSIFYDDGINSRGFGSGGSGSGGASVDRGDAGGSGGTFGNSDPFIN